MGSLWTLWGTVGNTAFSINSLQILLNPLPQQLSSYKQVADMHRSLGKSLGQSRPALSGGSLSSNFQKVNICIVAVHHQSRKGIQSVPGCTLNPHNLQPGKEMSLDKGKELVKKQPGNKKEEQKG